MDHDRRKGALELLRAHPDVRRAAGPAREPHALTIDSTARRQAIDLVTDPRRIAVPPPPTVLAAEVDWACNREQRDRARRSESLPRCMELGRHLPPIAVHDDEQRRGLTARWRRRDTALADSLDLRPRPGARAGQNRDRHDRHAEGNPPCRLHDSRRSASTGNAGQNGVLTSAASHSKTTRAVIVDAVRATMRVQCGQAHGGSCSQWPHNPFVTEPPIARSSALGDSATSISCTKTARTA